MQKQLKKLVLKILSNFMTFRCPAVCIFNTFLSSTFLVTVLTLDVIIKHHPISYCIFGFSRIGGKFILVFPAGGEGPHQGGPEEEGLRPKEELLGAQP